MIVALPKGIDAMRDYRAEVRAKAVEHGRDPDSIKIMYMASPFGDESVELAERRRAERLAISDNRAERRLLAMSDDIGSSQFDVDDRSRFASLDI